MRGKSSLFLIGLASLVVVAILGGCANMVLLHPRGPIGKAELNLILEALGLMLIVVIPVIAMAFWFPFKYSASNTRTAYAPKWSSSLRLELIFWLVPLAIVAILGYLAWSKTHQLDPYRPIEKSVKPIHVQVVSMDWKWLFIYPDQKVAVVNKLVFPVGVPLSFTITSDTVMNSFFIPQLGSQMYAMAGMITRLNLKADKPGVYYGQSQAFSGKGYADMSFQARAVSRNEFEGWLEKVARAPHKLDAARFKELQKPSTANPVTYFSAVEPGLFDLIVRQFVPMGPMTTGKTPAAGDLTKSSEGH
jgi:cytochrome o ubiquinol oxidase subunit 2